MGRIAGCCRRASAFASWRKRASMPGVHAISGWSTLHARRRSMSLSHSSYTSANPPRPTRRRTSYLEPSARARRWAVGTPASPAAGTAAAARSFVMTVGDGVPQLGQNAEPEGISARHEGQVSWVVTARKIRPPSARCNGGAVGDAMRPHHYLPAMLAVRIVLGLALAYVALVLLAWRFQERLAFPAPRAPVPDPKRVGVANGEKVELVSGDGTKLVGWYLKPKVGEVGGGRGRTGEV